METKHTPGPWENSPSCHVYAGEGELIADAGDSLTLGVSEMEANARLIAAAPELLDALNHARELIKAARGYFPKSIKNPDTFRLENTNATIEAAIAKATGDK